MSVMLSEAKHLVFYIYRHAERSEASGFDQPLTQILRRAQNDEKNPLQKTSIRTHINPPNWDYLFQSMLFFYYVNTL